MEQGSKIYIFGQTLSLPESCILHAKASVKSLEGIRYRCEDKDEVVYIYLTKFNKTEVERFKKNEIIQSFKELNIGKLKHYYFEVQTLPEQEVSFIHILCDKEICVQIFESSSKVVSGIKMQLKIEK